MARLNAKTVEVYYRGQCQTNGF